MTGFILATDYDRRGKVLEIALESEEFKQYIITPNQKGKELFGRLYSKVTVSGCITGEDVDGNPILEITDYEVIERNVSIRE
jgi:hypothetical protein